LSLANSNEWTSTKLEEALKPFVDEYGSMIADPRARNPQLTKIAKISDTVYEATHTLLDDKNDNAWFIKVRIDLGKNAGDMQLELLQIDS
jgi:hypothetical protein